MADLKKDKNPYANSDGTPIDGKEPKFFAWAREQELKRRKGLPASEVRAIEKSERALNRRMMS
jgi:hypothetical protein